MLKKLFNDLLKKPSLTLFRPFKKGTQIKNTSSPGIFLILIA
jgi:hypothetical protein